MPLVFKRLVLFTSIAVALWGDKQPAKFEVGPVSSYPARQTNARVSVATSVFETAEKSRPAFGTHNPYHYGILPILVIVQNDSDQAISLEDMRVEYIGPDGTSIEPTPANDVPFLGGGRKPNVATGPIPTSPRLSRKKNPLASWEIGARAFSAKMIPAGESANGFFYFQTGHRSGSRLYVTGIREARSGKEIFYFEIPLERVAN